MIKFSRIAAVFAAVLSVAATSACTQDSAAARGSTGGQPGGDSAQRGQGAPSAKETQGRQGQPGQPGQPGARGGGGPRTASIVLGPGDVARATRATVEATLAISGDLKAFDVNTVRSRIDGVIQRVFVREGQTVSAGMLLATFESSEQEAMFRSADAEVAAAKSDAETQKWNAEQSRELFKAGAIAERDLRLAEQTAEASKARLAAAEARQRTAANVLRDTKVVAPFAGAIEKRLVQDGENTPRGTQMFTMVRTNTLELLASLPARNAGEVKPGQSVRFTADGRQFSGKVARVSPTIDAATRSVAVYVTVPNPRGTLKGNTFATGQVVTSTVNDALVIPISAVRDNVDGTRRFVYRIQGDELAMAFVRIGLTDESRGMVEVLDGLKIQDQVVVGSPGTLGGGMKVQVIGNEPGRGGRRGEKSAP